MGFEEQADAAEAILRGMPRKHLGPAGQALMAAMDPKELPPLPDFPPPGTIFRHYKGGLYRFRFLAYREQDLEVMVVYSSAEDWGQPIFVRPLSEWQDWVGEQGEHPVLRRFEEVR